MVDRRDILTGLGCVGALGMAELLRPRRMVTLMPKGAALENIVPKNLPGYEAARTGDIVMPRTEGSLASTLYSDQLARGYVATEANSPRIMLLAAYGTTQSDTLQLHRPESCYPAIGFEIVKRNFIELPSTAGPIPAVALTATAGERTEDIVYWARLGSDLPRTSREQTWDRLRAAMAGYVSDGALVRASAMRPGAQSVEAQVSAFMQTLASALSGPARLALLGR